MITLNGTERIGFDSGIRNGERRTENRAMGGLDATRATPRGLRRAAAWIAAGVCLFAAAAGAAETYYVATNGVNTRDGKSWAEAWGTIGYAVTNVVDGDTIIVSNGVFLTGAQISITNGVTLQSLAGTNQTTIRRSAVKADAPQHRVLNVNHTNAVVDGFTIRGGYSSTGGGVNLTAGTLTNCLVTLNWSTYRGAGIWCGAKGRVTHTRVEQNVDVFGGGCNGGGIYLATGGVVTDCTIANNHTWYQTGGGVFMEAGTTLERSTLRGNRAEFTSGGGISIVNRTGGAIMIRDCIIHDNFGHGSGGGIYMGDGTTGGHIYIRNSLIARNYSGYVGGIYSEVQNVDTVYIQNCAIVGNICMHSSAVAGLHVINIDRVQVRNSIISDNVGPQSNPNWKVYSGTLNIQYSYTTPAISGTGNLTASPAPEFVNRAFDPWGFRRAGLHNAAPSGDARPRAGSRVIGAGTTNGLGWLIGALDLAGNPRLRADGKVDIGCFQYTPGTLDVGLIADAPVGLAPHTVRLTASVGGSETNGIVYYWDFGDGTPAVSGADRAVVTNIFQAGRYDVTLTVSNALGGAASDVRAGYILAAPATVYVAESGGNQPPYATPADAATNIHAAVAMATGGVTIQVGAGTYTVTNEIVLDRAVRLRGNPLNPAAAVLDAKLSASPYRRVVRIMHAQAVVEGLTLKGGRQTYGYYYSEDPNSGFYADNRFHGAGAQIYMGGTLQNCILTGNRGESRATALQTFYGGTVRSCLVYTNRGSSTIRCVLLTGGGTLENCTIVDNKWNDSYVDPDDRALMAESGTTVRNTIVRYNDARNGNNAYSPFGTNQYSGAGTVYYCNLDSIPSGSVGVQTNNPGFVNRSAWNYRLQPTSACVNAGQYVAWMTNAVDLDGRRRIFGTVDIGAYEYQLLGTMILLR